MTQAALTLSVMVDVGEHGYAQPVWQVEDIAKAWQERQDVRVAVKTAPTPRAISVTATGAQDAIRDLAGHFYTSDEAVLTAASNINDRWAFALRDDTIKEWEERVTEYPNDDVWDALYDVLDGTFPYWNKAIRYLTWSNNDSAIFEEGFSDSDHDNMGAFVNAAAYEALK